MSSEPSNSKIRRIGRRAAHPPGFALRLFLQSDMAAEIDRRNLSQGELSVGREPIADWVVVDPSMALSRLHCVFSVADGVLTLRDQSTNGVFVNGKRAAAEQVVIAPGDRITLGGFIILPEALTSTPQTKASPEEAAAKALRAGEALDAFCSGAQIDPSLFAGDEAADVMRRLGAVYREMVFGLAGLMDQRTRAKARYGLEWTTVQAADNNPFRWAPPQRVAVDLLQPGPDGFMGGGLAVRSSFADLRSHHDGLLAGSEAAVMGVVDALAPEAVGEPLKGQSFLIKNRQAALWGEYAEIHAKLRANLASPASPPSQAFRAAYERASSDD